MASAATRARGMVRGDGGRSGRGREGRRQHGRGANCSTTTLSKLKRLHLLHLLLRRRHLSFHSYRRDDKVQPHDVCFSRVFLRSKRNSARGTAARGPGRGPHPPGVGRPDPCTRSFSIIATIPSGCARSHCKGMSEPWPMHPPGRRALAAASPPPSCHAPGDDDLRVVGALAAAPDRVVRLAAPPLAAASSSLAVRLAWLPLHLASLRAHLGHRRSLTSALCFSPCSTYAKGTSHDVSPSRRLHCTLPQKNWPGSNRVGVQEHWRWLERRGARFGKA